MAPSKKLEEIAQLMRFIAEKSKNVTSPMNVWEISKQFQEETGSLVSIMSLEHRIKFHRNRIHEMVEFNTETKVKMIFALSASIDTEFLIELKKVAQVEVDNQRRIISYKQNGGGLELSVKYMKLSMKQREFPSRRRHFEEKQLNLCAARWNEICEKINKDELEEDEKGAPTWQKDYDKKRIDLVEFLIKRTKDTKNPMSIHSLAADFQTEFKSSESQKSTFYRIESFRQGICRLNQFDMSTKVKMMFALSAPVDGSFLKIIQKDAFVELDELSRIKTYIANDGSLELGVDHSFSANIQVGEVTALSGSTGEKYSQSTSLSQNLGAIQNGRKRVRQISEEKDDHGEPLKVEDDWAVNFDYDPSSYDREMDYIPIEKKPESLIEVKTEVPEGSSTSNYEYRYKDKLFEYDPPTYEKNLEHFPKEKKPESFMEVKLEVPEESSTNNLEYHYEDILTEPKPELSS